MTHIPLSPLHAPDKAMNRIIQDYLDRLGFLPNVLRLFGLRPRQAQAFFAPDGLYRELMTGESGLTPVEREMIAVVVSVTNGCHYCTASHSAFLRQKSGDPALADAVRADYQTAPLAPRVRAMLDHALLVTHRPGDVTPDDIARLRSHGFTDADIMDITQVAAIFNYTNRLMSALNVEPNPEFEQVGR